MRMIKTMQNGFIFYVVADCNRVHYRSMDKSVAKRELRLRTGRRKAKQLRDEAHPVHTAWFHDYD